MSNRTCVRAILLSVLMLCSVFAASGIAQAQTTPEVAIQDMTGDELDGSETVSLLADNVGQNDNVGAYEIDLRYNNTLLQLEVSNTNQFTVVENRSGSGMVTATIVGYTGSVDDTSGTVELANLTATARDNSVGNRTRFEITDVSLLVDTNGDNLGSNIVKPGQFDIVETIDDPPETGGDDDDDDNDGGDTTSPSRPSSPSNNEDTTDEDTTDDTTDEGDDDDTPTVDDIRNDLDEVEPNTQTRTAIVDNDPDRPGVTVSPEGTESVREITFSDEGASGNVDVREWQNPPQSVSLSVRQTVVDDSSSVRVPIVADIDPDSDEVRGSSAEVTMTVDSDRVDNPEDVVIVHERNNGWETLETTVEETNDGEIILTAETESFSLFAIAEVTEDSQTNDGTTDESDGGSTVGSDDGPGALVIIGVLVVLALIAAAAFAYTRQSGRQGNNGL